ncbi:MAG: alpha/beta hydrolase, partial [Bacteroidales bacterium]|nr:alpha/beta hydrolase [Bacteroidales bacterium]
EGNYNDTAHRFKGNKLTNSEIRFNRANKAFDEEPNARLGGASYPWVVKSCAQFDYIISNIDKIEIPFILFSAEDEQIVSLQAHRQFIDLAKEKGKTCEAYLIENAKHELFIEKDKARIEIINQVLTFFRKYQH